MPVERNTFNHLAAPIRVPSQRPLAPSVTLVTSVANDKDDNETIPRTVHRSPHTVEENSRKLGKLGDCQ